MKKLLFSIVAFLFAFLFFVTPTFAQTAKSGATAVLEKNQTVNGDYFTSGQSVSIDGVVNGDVYVGGGTVLIDGVVNGDVLAAGGNITISGTVHNVRVVGGQVEISGSIDGNVTAVGGNVTIVDSAKISGSVVSAGGQITILAPIGKGITLAGGQATIDNAVGGDVLAAASKLTIGSSAKIPGQVTYVSNNNASIDPGAQISGKVNHLYPPKPKNQPAPAPAAAAVITGFALFSKLISFVSLFVLGILLLNLFPIFSQKTLEEFITYPWLSLGIGVLAAIAMPVITIVLLLTVVGIALIPILWAAFFVVSQIGKIYAIIGFGQLFFQKNKKHSQNLILVLFVGLIIYELLTLIPILGGIVWIVVGAMGIGVLLISEYKFTRLLQAKKLL